jgi:hypothetical protein
MLKKDVSAEHSSDVLSLHRDDGNEVSFFRKPTGNSKDVSVGNTLIRHTLRQRSYEVHSDLSLRLSWH